MNTASGRRFSSVEAGAVARFDAEVAFGDERRIERHVRVAQRRAVAVEALAARARAAQAADERRRGGSRGAADA